LFIKTVIYLTIYSVIVNNWSRGPARRHEGIRPRR
jgi:hypothetical protein